MQNTTTLGLNRTGIQMSPVAGPEMIDAAREAPSRAVDTATDMLRIRQAYIEASDRIGSVPVPGTVSGVLLSGVQKMTGRNPEVLLDKLGERAAFERTGTRLYEALIAKCETVADNDIVRLSDLHRFHADEARHFTLIVDEIERLGGDPTAQTPCADTAGVASAGLLQVLTDPRTSVAQCLNAMLTAELTDHAGWELLIELARQAGQGGTADRFRSAFMQEEIHLATMREWLAQITLAEA